MRLWKIILPAVLLAALVAVGIIFLRPQEEIPQIDPVLTRFPDLPRNELDSSLLTEKDGFLQYGEERSLVGVDVSSHQGEIDWFAVKESGVDFAIIRAAYRGYTLGGLYMDPSFIQNLEGAAEAGLQLGVYLFSQAISAEEAAEEAAFVLECLDGRTLDLPIYFDWEYVEGESRTKYARSAVVTAAAEAFCAAIEEAGYDAGVYFNKSLGYTVLNLNRVKDYEFWLAQYLPEPDFYFGFRTWQYTDSGTVPGISTKVDLNLRFPQKEEAAQ